jgi:diguanylate cyclase (GGDEF)-like protein/PAS domain S-box-containing protein
LITGLSSMAILAIAVVISQFRTSYLERERFIQKQTEHYVKAMEAHVSYSIQSVDLSLIGFANAIKVLPAKQSTSPATMTALLSSRGSSFNSDYWITFIDPNGNAIATSIGDSVIGASYADRDYFKVHVNNSAQGQLFIGEPSVGKVSKKKLFFLSRRVETAKGEFLGVIAAPLNVERYAQVFENSRFNSDISIGLVHGSGKVIARVPNFENAFGLDLKASPLFAHAQQAPSGTYKNVSVIDNLSRIFSYRVVDGLPLIVVVGSNDTETARLQQQNYLIAGGGLAILLLLMLSAGHFSLRTYARQEERELRYRKLYSASREMALLFQNSGEGMMVTDAKGLILTVNPAFSVVSGYTEKELVGQRAYDLASGRNEQEFFDHIFKCVTESGHWKGELWHRRKDDEDYLVSILINTVYDEQGKPFRYVALLSDITQKKASEELIWRQANFDTLTGLPNRRMFHEHLRKEMKKTDRSHLPMALVFVDLDYFKEINDTLGHDKGDLLLKEVATRLLSCVRSTDTVARLGGDEFTVILSELRNSGDVARTAHAILAKMSTPFQLGDEVAEISSSIGITLYPEDAADAEKLLKNADQAMYAAKQQGRNRFHYFAPSMQEASRARISLVDELRQAVADEQLRVLYQPIVDLASGTIVKAEALVRWEHPVRGLLSPAEFLAVAESSGMIAGIDDWVFQQAARQALRLQAMTSPAFQVCVNKSASQFRDVGSNYRQWLDCLHELQLNPKSIVIEVTDKLLLDAANNNLRLEHEHMEICLDDFGAGCALTFLKRFEVDYIKINPADGLLICEAIIVMAHKLGIKVIAEGIENQQQLSALTAAGCDFGQGFVLSEPVLGEELEKQLQKQVEHVNK